MKVQDFYEKWIATRPNLRQSFHDAHIEAMAFAEAYLEHEQKYQPYLSDQYAKRILNAMFRNYSFELTINTPDDDIILFEIDTGNMEAGNNQIMLHIKRNINNTISIYVQKRSDSSEYIGTYIPETDSFDHDSQFWQVMFVEHLK